MNKKQFVYTTFQREGYHFYPGADTNPSTATNDRYDVSHLAKVHMHYFNFKVWIEVKHDNRDIEFIQLRRQIEDAFTEKDLKMGGSCEMMSDRLYEYLSSVYLDADIKIDISEEGINGSYTKYEAE